jgi:hypothetical protein
MQHVNPVHDNFGSQQSGQRRQAPIRPSVHSAQTRVLRISRILLRACVHNSNRLRVQEATGPSDPTVI